MTKHTDEQHPVSGVNITRSTLNLRIKPEDKILIDRAAHAAGKTEPSSYWKLRGVPPKKHWQIYGLLMSVPMSISSLLPDWIWHHSPVRR